MAASVLAVVLFAELAMVPVAAFEEPWRGEVVARTGQDP